MHPSQTRYLSGERIFLLWEGKFPFTHRKSLSLLMVDIENSRDSTEFDNGKLQRSPSDAKGSSIDACSAQPAPKGPPRYIQGIRLHMTTIA